MAKRFVELKLIGEPLRSYAVDLIVAFEPNKNKDFQDGLGTNINFSNRKSMEWTDTPYIEIKKLLEE